MDEHLKAAREWMALSDKTPRSQADRLFDTQRAVWNLLNHLEALEAPRQAETASTPSPSSSLNLSGSELDVSERQKAIETLEQLARQASAAGFSCTPFTADGLPGLRVVLTPPSTPGLTPKSPPNSGATTEDGDRGPRRRGVEREV